MNFTGISPFAAGFISAGNPADTGVIGTTITGGAPGPVTYSWSFVAPATNNPGGRVFLNPTTASSQRVRFSPTVASNATPQGVRVTATDSAGNISTQDGEAFVSTGE